MLVAQDHNNIALYIPSVGRECACGSGYQQRRSAEVCRVKTSLSVVHEVGALHVLGEAK
jgi:hypothetical protein